MITDFCQPGKVSFSLGGQFGSEGKGGMVAWIVTRLEKEGRHFNVVTTNNGAQSGHTSIHNGVKRVAFHLPTAPLVAPNSNTVVYLNAGCAIDPDVLMLELSDWIGTKDPVGSLFIHPNAAVITQECKDAENQTDSAQTRISSTRKGVGEALARKVLRSGLIARDCPMLRPFVRRIDLNARLRNGESVLVEVPQGLSLSINSPFYPYTTSRDCTITQAMNDAGIHPSFMGKTILGMRVYPIRVGSLPGHSSGDCYPDQREISWEELGVEAEITTVTKRVRRVFTWSQQQIVVAMEACRPDMVYLSFCDYLKDRDEVAEYVRRIREAARHVGLTELVIVCSDGPTTDDARVWKDK